jgi:SAM-dependent methyltransferase
VSLEAVRAAFDDAAPTYDEDFTASVIGRIQREALWRHLTQLFPRRGRLLDLGCGAGEDAVRFARRGSEVDGIDISPAMVELARERARAEGVEDCARFDALPIEKLDELPECGFDGAFSSFGPLNCVRDLRPVSQALADRVLPGAPVALCLMNRFCLWETALYPLTRQVPEAIRRFSGTWATTNASGNRSFPMYYRTVAQVRDAFAPQFTLERAPGIGVFVPPTYLEPFAQRFPALIRMLAQLDRLVGHWPVFRAIADNRVVVLRRCP